MSTPGLNPLSFNAWVQTIGTLAVALTEESSGVYGFVDGPLQQILPQILSYAEGRIQRDLDMLQARTSNTYTLVSGNNLLPVPVNDFLTIETVEITQNSGSTVVNSTPLTPVSREFIQNCYSGLSQSDQPRFFAMYGDNFADGANSFVNLLLGPPPNYAYAVRITGTIRMPSLYQYASNGPADSQYTYISAYYPDLLVMASMIFVSAFQRQFSSASDDPAMGQTYEKQYQALRLGAIAEENRKKLEGSGWSSYSTPVSATPTR